MSAKPRPPPDGDHRIGYRLEAVALTTFFLVAIAVGLRSYARVRYARVGWDDGLMVLAAIFALIATVTEIVGIDRGIGRHSYYLTPWKRQQQAMYNTISQTFCILSLCLCKISICISLLRILSGSFKKTVRWVLYATILVVSAVNVAVVVTLFTQCKPVRKVWNPSIPGKCFVFPTELDLAMFQGAVSAFTDFLLSGLPILIFQQLQIHRKNKIVLSILMGLGFFSGAIAIVRIVQTGRSIHSTGGDGSYGSVQPLLWAALERNVAIVAASIPSTRPLLHPFAHLTSRGLSYVFGRRSQLESHEFNVMPKKLKPGPSTHGPWTDEHGSEVQIMEGPHSQEV